MSVNIFGSGPVALSTTLLKRGPAGIGFKYLDDEGNFDLENKRLANVALPKEENDVSTKIYIDNLLFEIYNKFGLLQVECTDKLEAVEKRCIKQVNLLSTDDIEIKKYLRDLKEELTNVQVAVSSNENIKKINNQFTELESQVRAISFHIENKTAYDTIIFQTNAKLETDKFPFSLGMKCPSSKKIGYVMPYYGSIDRIVLSSLDFDKKITLKLWVNGGEHDRACFFKPEKEYHNIHKYVKIDLKEGDIIQFKASCDTENEKSMQIIQLLVK